MAGNKTFLSVTEQIVRRAVLTNTSVFYLVETLTSNLAEKVYAPPCHLYNIPVVSYRRAVRKAVKHAESLKVNDPTVHFMKSKFSIFWPKYHTAPHPNWYECHVMLCAAMLCICVCLSCVLCAMSYVRPRGEAQFWACWHVVSDPYGWT